MRKKDELHNLNHSCMNSAHYDEMVFVLLSRDAAAPVAIRAWVVERLRLGKNVETDRQIVEALNCAKVMETEGAKWKTQPWHYPIGMGEESRRLHREYNKLSREQSAGARNAAEVRKITDECEEKGIILVPGGENL
jgi:hypothetical protein